MGGAGQSRHLLLDSRVIEREENVRLALGRPVKDPANPLFAEDRPWEVRFDNLYANVQYDAAEKLYRCWYNPFIVCNATTSTPPEQRKNRPYRPDDKREMGLCYAVSRDGIAWEKPELGIVEYQGGAACGARNNLVMRDIHGVGVFHDPAEADSSRRYKAFMTGGAAVSPDGLRWERYACPEIGAVGDTHNNAFFDDASGLYVGFTRNWDAGQRIVARTESRDYRSWTRAVEVMRHLPGQPHRQTYALIAFPYANLCLGLVMVLDTEHDTVDAELAWSPDSRTWERLCPGTPLIPRGETGSFDWGCIYAAAYPVIHEREVRLYYGASDDTHGAWRKGCLALARLRLDGFAGMAPTSRDAVGQIVTRPVRCSGKSLRINADVVQGGELRVEVLGAERLSLAECKPTIFPATDAYVIWRTSADLTRLVGSDVQLRFELRGAKLYSFCFTE